MARLDDALRRSSAGVGLIEVLELLSGPVIDRRAAQEQRSAARTTSWAVMTGHPAVGTDPRLAAWLDAVRARGLSRRLAGDDELVEVETALDAISLIADSTAGWRLPVLAAKVTGDAHGLDRGRPAGTLVVNALAFLDEREHPKDAADWRRTWSDAGVACDDLSCDVLVLNLPGWPKEPLRLTLRQITRWQPQGGDPVFVCENPAVLAAAADELGERSPTIVCLDGMPSTAALLALEGLAAGGSDIRYHGDFDWRGLTIATVLMRKLPRVRAWRFRAGDYEEAIVNGLGTVPLTGRPSTSSWDPTLAEVMSTAGVAVYEEQVLPDLLLDTR